MYPLPVILFSTKSKHLNVFEKGYYTQADSYQNLDPLFTSSYMIGFVTWPPSSYRTKIIKGSQVTKPTILVINYCSYVIQVV